MTGFKSQTKPFKQIEDTVKTEAGSKKRGNAVKSVKEGEVPRPKKNLDSTQFLLYSLDVLETRWRGGRVNKKSSEILNCHALIFAI